MQTTLVVNNQTDGKHKFRGIPGHPPSKLKTIVHPMGEPRVKQQKLFNFEGGMAMDSPEYMFAIRLVINDQCGLHIETLQI